jgi:hypothetical protein
MYSYIEHLHLWPECDPAQEILAEVEQSNPEDSLEDYCNPEKTHSFQRPDGAVEESNKHSEIVFIDCSLL